MKMLRFGRETVSRASGALGQKVMVLKDLSVQGLPSRWKVASFILVLS